MKFVIKMMGLFVILVMCTGLVVGDRKMTIYEKLREDADLSQVGFLSYERGKLFSKLLLIGISLKTGCLLNG